MGVSQNAFTALPHGAQTFLLANLRCCAWQEQPLDVACGLDGEHEMTRISLKGVAIGNIVDIVSTYVVVLPLMIYVLISSKSGLPPDHVAASVTDLLKGSTIFVVSS